MYELADQVQMKKSIEDSAILVNASSVGMSPYEDSCLVPDQTFFHPELIVSDVIYNPRKTKLLRMAEDVGCSTFNGMYMLLYQGAYAFELWKPAGEMNHEKNVRTWTKRYADVRGNSENLYSDCGGDSGRNSEKSGRDQPPSGRSGRMACGFL